MTIEEAIFKVMDRMSHETLTNLDGVLTDLINAASRYFIDCPDDFCIQTIGHQSIVFGGYNRLLWNATHGFRPDSSYCTERFLQRCATLGDLPRGS